MRLLDLFCGAGGAAMGYHRAGFDEVVGVDIKPQSRYPFTFVQADALEYCAAHGHEFDAIHASPPCQAYTRARHIWNNAHPELIAPTRIALMKTEKLWVIENVVGAPLNYSITLCGTMFGLRVYRHRIFESNAMLLAPHCNHPNYLMQDFLCIYGGVVRGRQTGRVGNRYRRYTVADGRDAMRIDWMTQRELAESIPPAYTEFIGRQLIEHVTRREAGSLASTSRAAGADQSD